MVALVIFYCCSLFLLAQQNVPIWENEYTLWSRAYQLQPESAYINRNLAAAYVSMNDLDSAIYHVELSVRYGSPDTMYLTRLRAFADPNAKALPETQESRTTSP